MHARILVVDDDRDMLDAIAFTLEDAGYQVKTTEKAEYVQNLHDENGNLPSLILLDVLLSGRDGRQICKTLKKRKDTRHIPIIMISAHPTAEQSTKEVGADDFLAKPFDIRSLLNLVQKYLP